MECEATYRNEEVCPPLVGIARLTAKAKAQDRCVDEGQLARWEKLQAAVPARLAELHRSEAAGRTAFVYEIAQPAKAKKAARGRR